MKLDTPKLGVLGGMGPLATVDFLAKLIAVTPAEFDQDHIPTVIYSAPHTPDRTANIQGHGPSPLPYLLSGLAFLERSGVSCIAIPCNTAHFWYDQLSESTSVPIFHIADAACDCVAPRVLAGSCIGILATAGTLMARVYQQRIETRGFRCLEPAQSDVDDLIMPAIYLIKAGDMRAASPLLEQARMRLAERGAERIILGCTEIPIALPAATAPDLLVDATEALAYRCAGWWSSERANMRGFGKELAAHAD